MNFEDFKKKLDPILLKKLVSTDQIKNEFNKLSKYYSKLKRIPKLILSIGSENYELIMIAVINHVNVDLTVRKISKKNNKKNRLQYVAKIKINYINNILSILNRKSPEFNKTSYNTIIHGELEDKKKLICSFFKSGLTLTNYWIKYDIKEKNALKEINKIKLIGNTLLKCNKCGGDISVTFRQTRKADEGVTSFYTCTKCKHTWKK